VGILSSIVEPAAGFLFVHIADHLHHRAVGTELISDKVLALPASTNFALTVPLNLI
jgi:hypothetical protein